MTEVTPTRSAVLELQEERRAMREGYQFLDEKRLLLAAEILHELKAYEQAWRALAGRLEDARLALREAIGRHGLDGVQVYPAASLGGGEIEIERRSLLGVALQEATFRGEMGVSPPAANPSPEAERCRDVFLDVLRQSASLAALAGNLERLRHEYRRTERRARALEDVLMPEVDQLLYELESRLEEIEQEEAVRVRIA